jgi:hypothetical protein
VVLGYQPNKSEEASATEFVVVILQWDKVIFSRLAGLTSQNSLPIRHLYTFLAFTRGARRPRSRNLTLYGLFVRASNFVRPVKSIASRGTGRPFMSTFAQGTNMGCPRHSFSFNVCFWCPRDTEKILRDRILLHRLLHQVLLDCWTALYMSGWFSTEPQEQRIFV